MRSNIDVVSLAGGVLGAGLVGPWFVLGQQIFVPDVLWWQFALGVGVLAGFVGGAVGIRVTITPETRERLHSRWITGALLSVPVVCTVACLSALVLSDAAPSALLVATASGIGLAPLGLLAMRRAVDGLYGERIALDEPIRLPQRRIHRRLRYFRSFALGAVGAGVVIAGVVFVATGEWFPLYISAMGGLSLVVTPDRNVEITDAGLAIGQAVHPWSAFESVRFEAEALVVERVGRLRTAYRFPRESIGDENAVWSALSAALEEQEKN